MAKLEYWESIAGFALPLNEDIQTGKLSIIEMDRLIAETFEKGIALLVVNDPSPGNKYLQICKSILENKANIKKDSLYFLYSYLIKWLYSRELNPDFLRGLVSVKWDEFLEDIIHYEIWEIYDTCMKASAGRMKRDPNIQRMGLKKGKTDKYPYESAGDQLIEISRYNLLMDNYFGAKLSLEAAQKLYSKALELIPKMLTKRNRKWKEVEGKTDIQIRNEFPQGEYEYYLKERENLRSDIPLYRWQGEVLLHLEKYMGHISDVKDTKQKVDDFFEQVINPKEAVSSSLFITDEIIWVMLKLKFEQKSLKMSLYQDPVEYLRMNLS